MAEYSTIASASYNSSADLADYGVRTFGRASGGECGRGSGLRGTFARIRFASRRSGHPNRLEASELAGANGGIAVRAYRGTRLCSQRGLGASVGRYAAGFVSSDGIRNPTKRCGVIARNQRLLRKAAADFRREQR